MTGLLRGFDQATSENSLHPRPTHGPGCRKSGACLDSDQAEDLRGWMAIKNMIQTQHHDAEHLGRRAIRGGEFEGTKFAGRLAWVDAREALSRLARRRRRSLEREGGEGTERRLNPMRTPLNPGPDDHYLRTELYERIQADPELFDFLQNGSLDGLWYWDLERPEHEWISPRFWEVLGYDPRTKQHLASEWQSLIHPDDLKAAVECYERHFADPEYPYDLEVRYRHRTGFIVWVRCRGLAIRRADGTPVRMLGAHQDITALKNAEARALRYGYELKSRAEQLELRTSELKAANERLSRFAYVVSHDLKAPLRGIVTCVDWLHDELGDDLSSDARENFELLKSRTDRLVALLDGVLRYSRVGSAKQRPELVDTNALVPQVVSQLTLPDDLQISYPASFPAVRYDPTELAQVFQILLSNAIRFTGRADGRIEVRAESEPGGHRFSVADNGSGIAPEDHDRIFEIFATGQAQDDHESLGIGLTLARAIVERNGGTIGVRSAPGVGSTFWFTVPEDRQSTEK